MTKHKAIKVYYNSACPVCKAGIDYQRSKTIGSAIDWQDINENASLCDEISAELKTVRKYLHLRDHFGERKTGIDAFILLWRASPKQRWLAGLIGLPIIKQIAALVYFLFANALYAWNRALKHW